MFRVEYFDGTDWTLCVREDLIEAHAGDTRELPAATFPTRPEAERFITTMCGLIHCGGDPATFRVTVDRLSIKKRGGAEGGVLYALFPASMDDGQIRDVWERSGGAWDGEACGCEHDCCAHWFSRGAWIQRQGARALVRQSFGLNI